MYDEKCYDLAETFLVDYPHFDNPVTRSQLAQEIQSTIEDFLQDLEAQVADIEKQDPADPNHPAP